MRAISIGLILGILLGSILAIYRGGVLSTRTGGDYVAFYAAAKIILSKEAKNLYDPLTQAKEQAGLGKDLDGDSVQYFPYPAYVAVFFAPLAIFPIAQSFLLYAITLLSLLWFSSKMLGKISGLKTSLISATLLSFTPTALSILGGQNTVISIFLLTAFVYGLGSNKNTLTALSLGLLYFKPQLALPFTLYLIFVKNWRMLGQLILVGLLLYIVGTLAMGYTWSLSWLKAISFFSSEETVANNGNFASPFGALQSFWRSGALLASLEYMIAATVIAFALYAIRFRESSHEGRIGIVILCLPFLSYHFQYYDVGILSVGFFLLFYKRLEERFYQYLLIFLWCAAALILLTRLADNTYSFAFIYVAILTLSWVALIAKKKNCRKFTAEK